MILDFVFMYNEHFVSDAVCNVSMYNEHSVSDVICNVSISIFCVPH